MKDSVNRIEKKSHRLGENIYKRTVIQNTQRTFKLNKKMNKLIFKMGKIPEQTPHQSEVSNG
jgi:hypothetical protein